MESKNKMDDFISYHLDAANLHEKIEEQLNRAAIHHAIGNEKIAILHTEKAYLLSQKASELIEKAFNEMQKLKKDTEKQE